MSFIGNRSTFCVRALQRSLHTTAGRSAGAPSSAASGSSTASGSGTPTNRSSAPARGPRSSSEASRIDSGRALASLFKDGRGNTESQRQAGGGVHGKNAITTPLSTANSLSLIGSASGPGGANASANRVKRFFKGRTYAPSDLNMENVYAEQKMRARPLLGPSRSQAEQTDPLFKLGLRPGHISLADDSYKNPVLLSAYVTDMGKIMQRRDTNLTRRSQREVAKAIRRARSMGLMPVMSKYRRGW